ncbi:MAG: TRM11 family SAM-dependent methyltransferase [Candidatus Heimdallarchaeaceae archaeon]
MPSEIQTKETSKLFWNVQFIYELVLAKKELEAFKIDYQIDNSLRNINVSSLPNKNEFINRTAYFEKIEGISSLYSKITKANVTRSMNQYLTHWFYPYKGKFHPQLIRALLNIMKVQPGETVLDSFIGSGTTALEAQLLGINCIGTDISEVCTRVTRAKTHAFQNIDDIVYKFENMFQDLRSSSAKYTDTNEEIRSIEHLINSLRDTNVENFYRVAYLIAHSDKARRKKKNFTDSFLKNAEKMIRSLKDFQKIISDYNLNLGDVQVNLSDAKKLDIETKSIDGIVCSPPYSIALNYVENDKHALEALGYDTKEIKEDFIGVRGTGKTKTELYNSDLIAAYSEMDRVLKPGKLCSIVIGNATFDKKEINTVDYTIDIFQDLGYSLEMNVDKIIFGLYNVMQKENILVFKKP